MHAVKIIRVQIVRYRHVPAVCYTYTAGNTNNGIRYSTCLTLQTCCKLARSTGGALHRFQVSDDTHMSLIVE
jgi:hypothetical protein